MRVKDEDKKKNNRTQDTGDRIRESINKSAFIGG